MKCPGPEKQRIKRERSLKRASKLRRGKTAAINKIRGLPPICDGEMKYFGSIQPKDYPRYSYDVEQCSECGTVALRLHRSGEFLWTTYVDKFKPLERWKEQNEVQSSDA